MDNNDERLIHLSMKTSRLERDIEELKSSHSTMSSKIIGIREELNKLKADIENLGKSISNFSNTITKENGWNNK